MATALYSDFKVYNAEFQAGLWEGLSQAVNGFNAASRGAIRLVRRDLKGHYAKEAMFKQISSLITRRDIDSTSAATAVKPTQDEFVSVKVNRKIGPIEFTLDAVKKIGSDASEMSFILGQMVGEAKAADMLNTGVLSVEAAIEAQSTSLTYDATALSVKTLATDNLIKALAKFGDRSERVVAWVMHSKPYFDLVSDQVAGAVTNVADRVIYGATPGTLNRPVVISDIPALWDLNGSSTDTYNVLGLVADGVVIEESEQSEMVTEVVTGGENLLIRMQGEFAMNIGCKGTQWDITNGGKNPTDAALGTTTNWDKVVTSVKDMPGVRITCQ